MQRIPPECSARLSKEHMHSYSFFFFLLQSILCSITQRRRWWLPKPRIVIICNLSSGQFQFYFADLTENCCHPTEPTPKDWLLVSNKERNNWHYSSSEQHAESWVMESYHTIWWVGLILLAGTAWRGVSSSVYGWSYEYTEVVNLLKQWMGTTSRHTW